MLTRLSSISQHDGHLSANFFLRARWVDQWMAGGKKSAATWQAVLHLDAVAPDTLIGIVGRNFLPSDWSEPIGDSRHSVVLRCGDGSLRHKGRATSLKLRPLPSGSAVR